MFVVFKPFNSDDPPGGSECPSEYLVDLYADKDRAVRNYVEKVEGLIRRGEMSLPGSRYTNLKVKAVDVEGKTLVNIYADLAPGVTMYGTDKKTGLLIETMFIIVSQSCR